MLNCTEPLAVDSMSGVDGASGAAKRRRERRQRSWLRHEQLSVKMALSAALHHSRGVGPVLHEAPRGPKTDRAVEEEVRVEHVALEGQKRPPPGERPAPLSEVAGPEAAVTVGYVAAAVPRLTPVVMEQGPAHDNSTSAWLLARSLEEQQQHEEEVRHGLEVERLQVARLQAERRLRVALEEFMVSPSRPSWSSCSPVTKAAVHWFAAQTRVEKKMREGGGFGGREPG